MFNQDESHSGDVKKNKSFSAVAGSEDSVEWKFDEEERRAASFFDAAL